MFNAAVKLDVSVQDIIVERDSHLVGAAKLGKADPQDISLAHPELLRSVSRDGSEQPIGGFVLGLEFQDGGQFRPRLGKKPPVPAPDGEFISPLNISGRNGFRFAGVLSPIAGELFGVDCRRCGGPVDRERPGSRRGLRRFSAG